MNKYIGFLLILILASLAFSDVKKKRFDMGDVKKATSTEQVAAPDNGNTTSEPVAPTVSPKKQTSF